MMSAKRASLYISLIMFFIGLTLSDFVSADTLIMVPDKKQEHSNWCWAASSQAVLAYYGAVQDQCAVANFGCDRSDCCGSTVYEWNSPCNTIQTLRGVQNILTHWNVSSLSQNWALTWDVSVSEINSGRPFMIGLKEYTSGGSFVSGHLVVGVGYDSNGKIIDYMDPDYGYVRRETYDDLFKLVHYDDSRREWGESLKVIMNPPTCNTYPAQSVTENSATFGGTVRPNNMSTTVSFEYGPTSAYGSTATADQSPVNGAAAMMVSKALTGLTPNTTYHYRLKAVNSSGTHYGSDQSFTTAAPTITLNKLGTGTGNITSYLLMVPGGGYQLVATPDAGSAFSGWSGDCGGTGDCYIYMMWVNHNLVINATFDLAPVTLSVTKSGAGTGTLTSSPGSINCGSSCSNTFNYGTSVTLTASPDNNSLFAGWSGACSGTGACVVNMNANKSVTATFSPKPSYTITVVPAGCGTISPAGPITLLQGSSQTFNFQPNAGSVLSNVLVDGKVYGSAPIYTLPNLSANHTISAIFGSPYGDTNNSGFIDVADALMTLRVVVGLIPVTPQILALSDVAPVDANGYPAPDGHVTISDALMILKKTVGLPSWNTVCSLSPQSIAPAEPLLTTEITPLSTTASPSLTLIPSGNGTYTIQGTNMNGVSSIQLYISYDTAALGSPSVALGSLSLASGATYSDSAALNSGFISISIITTNSLSGSGPIAVISFGTWNAASAASTLDMYYLRDIDGQLLGALIPYSVNASVTSGGGTITPASAIFTNGNNATLTITPNAGYHLASLTDNGANVMGSVIGNTYTISNISAAHNVVATFASSAAAPVPALGPWGLLMAAGGMGALVRRNRRAKGSHK